MFHVGLPLHLGAFPRKPSDASPAAAMATGFYESGKYLANSFDGKTVWVRCIHYLWDEKELFRPGHRPGSDLSLLLKLIEILLERNDEILNQDKDTRATTLFSKLPCHSTGKMFDLQQV
ncbi:unnamed protein product [Larinioides sclopetarius]|uniref:Uncharacterized protein n=1 Tax=Larinioides sclopetarius TaxID=280406 RepID=A0AAV1ZMJ3_9ARAC